MKRGETKITLRDPSLFFLATSKIQPRSALLDIPTSPRVWSKLWLPMTGGKLNLVRDVDLHLTDGLKSLENQLERRRNVRNSKYALDKRSATLLPLANQLFYQAPYKK